MYVSSLAKQLNCDEKKLEIFIKKSGQKYDMNWDHMVISDTDVDIISNMWKEMGESFIATEEEERPNDKEDADALFVLNGRNGTVKVTQKVVIISREGVIGFFASGVMGQGDKRIRIKSIVSVELGKEPSFWGGISYIRFATAADNEVRKHSSFGDPSLRMFENKGGQYFNDPNTIQLSNMEQYNIAIKIRDYIENYQSESIAPTVVQPLSGADEILKYKKLLDDGILTQEEFDAKKKQLLEL